MRSWTDGLRRLTDTRVGKKKRGAHRGAPLFVGPFPSQRRALPSKHREGRLPHVASRCLGRVGGVVIALATLGCARHRAQGDLPPRAEWLLKVENHHWLDVRVLVVHDGQTTPVGTVTAATTSVFVLAPNLLGQAGAIRLTADPVGGRSTVQSEAFRVRPGQQVVWTLESSLNRSSVAVW